LDYYDKVSEAAQAIRARVGQLPSIAVVLGSGLGGFTDRVHDGNSWSYEELPHWPSSSVAGHAGRLVVGTVRTRPVAVLAGRWHLYERHDLRSVTLAVRVLGLLGTKALILTNAAGGINTTFAPGDLMVVDDHINLMGLNPLAGLNDDRFGPRFPDMTEVYSSRLRALAERAGRDAGIALRHGIYAGVAGPSYETPAEIRYLRMIGADAVGMSTVPEAIVARHMGIEVLAISCISNLAAGIDGRRLDHAEVVDTTARAGSSVAALLEGIIGHL